MLSKQMKTIFISGLMLAEKEEKKYDPSLLPTFLKMFRIMIHCKILPH